MWKTQCCVYHVRHKTGNKVSNKKNNLAIECLKFVLATN